ncbi:hypothetical protein MHK_004890, partial [Candidatus Magnetomorum sp. HK-1]
FQNPDNVGLTEENLQNLHQNQRSDIILGEYFAEMSKQAGLLASKFLYRGQWLYNQPEFFDHRLHWLNPDKWFMDHWCLTAMNVIQKLPLNGHVLDLCSGDGFFSYHFYRKRAKQIDCVEIQPNLYRHALRLYSAENINNICESVLTYNPKAFTYDVVVIRGAIEHFTEIDQRHIFQKVDMALKPDGWFIGDTVANPDKNGEKLLNDHENEWVNEEEMRDQLQPFFSHVETQTLISSDRTNLFWCCKK